MVSTDVPLKDRSEDDLCGGWGVWKRATARDNSRNLLIRRVRRWGKGNVSGIEKVWREREVKY